MNKALEVYLPYPKKRISQRFGVNENGSYANAGLRGHTSYDWDVPHGTVIPNCTADAFCYSTLNAGNPDPSRYRAAYFLVPGWNGFSDWSEVSYGHMDKVLAKVGETYQVNDAIGTVGNTGTVFTGDHEVTRQERLNGSKAGAHLHGPQIRPVRLVAKRSPGKQYLRDSKGYYRRDGLYFEVVDYANGFNGCITLAPFSTEKLTSEYAVAAEAIEVVKEQIAIIPELPEPERAPRVDKVKSLLDAIFKFLFGGT